MSSDHLLVRNNMLELRVNGVDKPLDSWYQVFGKVSVTS